LMVILFLVLLISLFLSIRSNYLKLSFAIALLGLLYINIQIDACTLRHVGFYFITYVVCIWLDAANEAKPILSPKYILMSLLCLQAFWGLRMYTHDWHHPFSAVENCCNYLKQNLPNNTKYYAYGEVAISGCAANLKMPIINIRTMHPSQFVRWTAAEIIPEGNADSILQNNMNTAVATNGSYVFITNQIASTRWLTQTLDSLCQSQPNAVKKMPEFTGAIVPTENFSLYKIDSTIVW
jgi:hypothetical protein